MSHLRLKCPRCDGDMKAYIRDGNIEISTK